MNRNFLSTFSSIRVSRSLVFALMIVGALLCFELFNYGTTEYTLIDLLGDTSVIGVKWATVLALAFCGMDFAGIARIFTPQTGKDEPLEVWYLFGAWVLAATMNAALTWWGVSAALATRNVSNVFMDRNTVLMVVPAIIAVMVFLTRILIIGTVSVAGEKWMHPVHSKHSQSAQLIDRPPRPASTSTLPFQPQRPNRPTIDSSRIDKNVSQNPSH